MELKVHSATAELRGRIKRAGYTFSRELGHSSVLSRTEKLEQWQQFVLLVLQSGTQYLKPLDYSKAKSFPPMTLSPLIFKTLERVVLAHLEEFNHNCDSFDAHLQERVQL